MDDKINIFRCKECRETQAFNMDSWDKTYCAQLYQSKLCTTCHFWTGHMKDVETGNPAAVVVKGVKYHAGPYTPSAPPYLLGHGGMHFHIKWHDGRTATTNNLWCNGTIPYHFRARMPNNAEFMDQAPTNTPLMEEHHAQEDQQTHQVTQKAQAQEPGSWKSV